MKGPTAGLSQQPGGSGGQPGLGGAREGRRSPHKYGTGRACQTGRAGQARQDGATTSEPVVEPPQAASRLESGGWGRPAAHADTGGLRCAATPEVTAFVPEEATGKVCGVPAARLPG